MNRKQAISHVAGIFGIAISAPVILSGMAGCNETPGRKVAGLFLTEKEWEIVNRVSVILLPGIATIEDGGIQATTFIDKILYYSASTSQQESLRVQLSRFVQECEDSAGIEFMHSSSTKQYQFTKKLFERSFIEKKSDPTAGLPFLLFIKQQSLIWYCTSEQGASSYLKYVAVPGEFRGCVPLQEIGGAWATY